MTGTIDALEKLRADIRPLRQGLARGLAEYHAGVTAGARSANTVFGVVGLVLLASIIGCSVLLVRQVKYAVIDPLRGLATSLTAGAHKLNGRDIREAIAGRRDEVGVLARALVEFERLSGKHLSLEQQAAAERSAELEKIEAAISDLRGVVTGSLAKNDGAATQFKAAAEMLDASVSKANQCAMRAATEFSQTSQSGEIRGQHDIRTGAIGRSHRRASRSRGSHRHPVGRGSQAGRSRCRGAVGGGQCYRAGRRLHPQDCGSDQPARTQRDNRSGPRRRGRPGIFRRRLGGERRSPIKAQRPPPRSKAVLVSFRRRPTRRSSASDRSHRHSRKLRLRPARFLRPSTSSIWPRKKSAASCRVRQRGPIVSQATSRPQRRPSAKPAARSATCPGSPTS